MSRAARTFKMQLGDILGLVLTIAGLAYLLYAMLRPEKF
jgi:K+-transporting ATPase KdpF subunit